MLESRIRNKPKINHDQPHSARKVNSDYKYTRVSDFQSKFDNRSEDKSEDKSYQSSELSQTGNLDDQSSIRWDFKLVGNKIRNLLDSPSGIDNHLSGLLIDALMPTQSSRQNQQKQSSDDEQKQGHNQKMRLKSGLEEPEEPGEPEEPKIKEQNQKRERGLDPRTLNGNQNQKQTQSRNRDQRLSRNQRDTKSRGVRHKSKVEEERCWIENPVELFRHPLTLIPECTMTPAETLNTFTRILIVILGILWILSLSLGTWFLFLLVSIIIILVLYYWWARHPPRY